MSDDELGEQLAAVVGAPVRGLVRLSGGASRETWAFDTDAGDRLILQRERAGVVRGNGGITAEAALLRAAAAIGVPVADLVAAGGADGGLGASFLITRRLDGETIARKILREPEFDEARGALAAQCGAALAGIHSIDPSVAPSLDQPDQVDMYRDVLDGFAEPHPAFELGFRWLYDNRPPTTRTSVVHGDFRLGNLIVDRSGLRAVLDWEIAHLGDPMEDLGWLCVKAWRFGGARPVAGVGDYEELFDAYGEAAGVDVEPDVVRWWEVLGTLKWGVMCIMQASAHLFGMTRSVELAAIGRRVRAGIRPHGNPPVSEMYGRPTAAELVEAVREFLESDVMAATDGRVQFHTRVAINVLNMVQRELELGPEQLEAHRARLAALGVADERELADAIRNGDLDDRLDEVRAAVTATVADKLRVANPKRL